MAGGLKKLWQLQFENQQSHTLHIRPVNCLCLHYSWLCE